jgi:hypothetical protein
MNRNNIDQALAALGDALKGQEPPPINILELVAQIPDRSLSGNHINGGKITNFSSAGIVDTATSPKLKVTDNAITVENLNVEQIVSDVNIKGDINVEGTARIKILEVESLSADINITQNNSIKYQDSIDGKGFFWAGSDYTRQFVYQSNKIFSSENIDIAKGKQYSINDIKIIDQDSLGESVTKSNLREVGRLKGLIVDGQTVINNYFVFDANTDRFGIGTEEPNAALSIAEDGVEIVVGTKDFTRGAIGTFGSHELDLMTDNVARINVGTNGNILLGNRNSAPVQVSVHGKMAIKVNTPDPDVDLHVNGAVKFNGKLQRYGNNAPSDGEYNRGDIFWNNEPAIGSYVGWICTKSGGPGSWEPFGKIGNQ